MSEDWIKNLIDGAQNASDAYRRGKKLKKFCQWVESATGPRGCSGIVVQTGTIYCPYHQGVWDSMIEEHTQTKRKPKVD